MISSISSITDKTFIIGYVLPLLLFLFFAALLFSDYAVVGNVLHLIAKQDVFESLTYLVIGLWVLSLLLQLVNHAQLQMLEGYRWPVSRISYLKKRQVARFLALKRRFQRLDRAWVVANKAGAEFPEKKKAAWAKARTEFVNQYPGKREWVLPTRLGNAIRAFERYSGSVYGADSIPLWINLMMIVPKEVQEALEDARAQVNCLANIVCFSAVLFLVAACRFILSFDLRHAVSHQPHWIELPVLAGDIQWVFAGAALAAVLVAWGAYALLLEQVFAWGGLVKAAFDCFLPALATSLGYDLPDTAQQRKAFWTAVSRRVIFHQPLVSENWVKKPKDAWDT